MAKKSLIVKSEKLRRKLERAVGEGRKMKKATKAYNRCKLCGRPKGYMRQFGICRICFRELAARGEITGVRKSSW